MLQLALAVATLVCASGQHAAPNTVCLSASLGTDGFPSGCDCTTITSGTPSQQNGAYNLCQACINLKGPTSAVSLAPVFTGSFADDNLAFRLCLEYVRDYANQLGAVSDPVWSPFKDVNNVFRALKCNYGLAQNNLANSLGWTCNNCYLRQDAYACTLVPGLVTGFIKASKGGYVNVAQNTYGEYQLQTTSNKATALKVTFDWSTQPFSIQAVTGPTGFVGAAWGFTASKIGPNLPGYAQLGAVSATTPAYSTAQSVVNTISENNPVETSIWFYDPTSRGLRTQWVNTDSTVASTVVVNSNQNTQGASFLAITGSSAKYCTGWCLASSCESLCNGTPDEVTLSIEA